MPTTITINLYHLLGLLAIIIATATSIKYRKKIAQNIDGIIAGTGVIVAIFGLCAIAIVAINSTQRLNQQQPQPKTSFPPEWKSIVNLFNSTVLTIEGKAMVIHKHLPPPSAKLSQDQFQLLCNSLWSQVPKNETNRLTPLMNPLISYIDFSNGQ